ncbi:MAG: hypothetical protein GY953_51970, partial [bacterium]|nr:hypothetical protein [bacterium]
EQGSREIKERLIQRSEASGAGLLVDTVVAPSYEEALAEVIQRPGVSGMPNNSVLFEFAQHAPDEIAEILDGFRVGTGLGFNVCILRSSEFHFGYRRNIHVWLTKDDYVNAPLMILLAYIISGHPEWRAAEISIFACFPRDQVSQELSKLHEMISEGRLPIPSHRVVSTPYDDELTFEDAVSRHSSEADLVILGLDDKCQGGELTRELIFHPQLNEVLFVRASEQISIS